MFTASIVNNITLQFNRYVPIPVLIFGLIGNIFNILIFIRPLLIKNPCSIYFLCLSIVNLNVLAFGLVTEFFSDGFGTNVISSSLAFCRIRYFILHSSMVLSSLFVILAGIDRYCISSRNAKRRQLSNLKYARYLVVFTTLLCCILYSHVFGFFTIEQLKYGSNCYAQAGIYRIFYDILLFATYSFTPSILMIILGLKTFYNIHRPNTQVAPMTINRINVYQLRKRDLQLIKMLLIQFIFTVVLTLPVAIQKLYCTFTQNANKSYYQLAIEKLIISITYMLVFINSCTSFYVFTLSGSLYRKELIQILIKMIGSIFGNNSSIYRKFQELTEQQLNIRPRGMIRRVTTVE